MRTEKLDNTMKCVEVEIEGHWMKGNVIRDKCCFKLSPVGGTLLTIEAFVPLEKCESRSSEV